MGLTVNALTSRKLSSICFQSFTPISCKNPAICPPPGIIGDAGITVNPPDVDELNRA